MNNQSVTSNPTFSILIPTKNRSHIVSMAIESVLNQTFDDYEIILSDNDDSETDTRNVVSQFTDPRLKYFRTDGTLSMPDNWEFALNQSSGQYVTVLEDKQTLYKDALEILSQVITAKQPDVITWAHDVILDEPSGKKLCLHKGGPSVKTISSSQVLSSFAQRPRLFVHLPRMLNSLASRKLIEKIYTQKYNNRFFVPTTPDLSAAFTQLNFVDEIYYVDHPLSIWGGAKLSNAKRLREKSVEGKRFVDDMGSEQSVYNFVPIKSIYLAKNLVINDYMRLAEEFGGKLKEYPISDLAYMFACHQDITKALDVGTDMQAEVKMWQSHLKTLDMKTQFSIRSKILKESIAMAGMNMIERILGENRASEIIESLTNSTGRLMEPWDSTTIEATHKIDETRTVIL